VTASIGVLPFVLSLTAGAQHACAQHLVCDMVRPSSPPALIAMYSTENGQNWRRRVGVAEEMIRNRARRLGNERVASARMASLQAGFAEEPVAIDLGFVWGGVFLLISMLLACIAADMYVEERQAILHTMKRFGEKFIHEFERPLFQRRIAEHPIRSRLRFAPHRRRVEVLVAPNEGRSYPNLSDHKRNLEYDVERILQLLKDEPFHGGPPHAEGRWVVIPFQCKADLKAGGAK
jgi:hypothetical protein